MVKSPVCILPPIPPRPMPPGPCWLLSAVLELLVVSLLVIGSIPSPAVAVPDVTKTYDFTLSSAAIFSASLTLTGVEVNSRRSLVESVEDESDVLVSFWPPPNIASRLAASVTVAPKLFCAFSVAFSAALLIVSPAKTKIKIAEKTAHNNNVRPFLAHKLKSPRLIKFIASSCSCE